MSSLAIPTVAGFRTLALYVMNKLPQNDQMAHRVAAWLGHTVTNLAGIGGVVALTLWSDLPSEWAAGLIAAICGIWSIRGKEGRLPPGPPGLSGFVASLGGAGLDLLTRLR